MEKRTDKKLEVQQGFANEIPGLLSFINTNNNWSFLNSDWIEFIEPMLIEDHLDKKDLIHPSDVESYSRVLQNAFEKKVPFTIDIRIKKNDGNYVYVRETGKPVKTLNGELTGFNCLGLVIDDLYADKRERFNLEQMFRIIMNYSIDMLCVYDHELRLITMNRKSEEVIGLPANDIIGKKYSEIFPNSETTQGYSDLMLALKGEMVHNTRFDSKITQRTYENFLFPLKDQNEQIYAVLAIAHDYTDQIKTTVELEKAYRIMEEKNRELERSNKELGSFTYVASHDLQEPLRKIQAFGKRIVEKEQEFLSDSGKDYLSRMVDAAHRMQKLIDSLLEFSRTATATKKFETADLNILIEDVKRENRFSIEEKQAVIEVAPLPKLSVVPFQFKQLVSNLLSNSLKYTKEGENPHIKIEADLISSKALNRPDLATGNYCRISFSDNGIGFDPVFSTQIFELFQRLHGRGEYSGSGIGLSICKRIVENHEGFITAEGRPGDGSTFYIYLPVKH